MALRNGKRTRTRCTKPATLDKGRKAFELRAMGWTFPEIGDELKMSPGGIHELYTAFVEAMPRTDVEAYRLVLLAGLDAWKKVVAKDKDNRSWKVRHSAARAFALLTARAAEISGVTRIAPTVVVMPRPDRERELELSRASIDDLRELERIKHKMEAPALEVHAVTIEAEGVEHEREEQRSGSGDSGAGRELDDRA